MSPLASWLIAGGVALGGVLLALALARAAAVGDEQMIEAFRDHVRTLPPLYDQDHEPDPDDVAIGAVLALHEPLPVVCHTCGAPLKLVAVPIGQQPGRSVWHHRSSMIVDHQADPVPAVKP